MFRGGIRVMQRLVLMMHRQGIKKVSGLSTQLKPLIFNRMTHDGLLWWIKQAQNKTVPLIDGYGDEKTVVFPWPMRLIQS